MSSCWSATTTTSATASGRVNGQPFDAGLTNDKGAGAGDNDSVILVYRPTLPGR